MPTYKIKTRPRVILGVDPGYADAGYGIIKKEGARLRYIACATISSPARTPLGKRLIKLRTGLDAVIAEFQPELAGVEKIFFTKNQKTAIDVAHARGVIMLVLAERGIPVIELTPIEIKQRVTSYGHARKEQVARMVCRLLSIAETQADDNALDALAVAICAASENLQHALVKKQA